MAINIFSGTTGKSKINSASQSTRAQAAKSALAAPAEVSNSGGTAVKTGGTLAKIGNFVGKAAGFASKYLPGVAGTIASGLANLINDPEWWQSVPGDAVTLNSPLRITSYGGVLNGVKASIGEFFSAAGAATVDNLVAIYPTEMAVTQYLMPQIRKVVNAIPLQTANTYRVCLQVNATLYAMWRQVKKFDYMLKHGQTYLANMNDSYLPLFQVENAAYLQSTINRLEEYLRANVRLPHTLCEYLAWRYGRVYKSNDSAKAGLILYDVLDLTATPTQWSEAIALLMGTISANPYYQQANTDLYNAYYDHDFMVEIKDETQFIFDTKEFMLRTNLNVQAEIGTFNDPTLNVVVVDSRLDNPTTFMASTVSTTGSDDAGGFSTLFPVRGARVYLPRDPIMQDISDEIVGIPVEVNSATVTLRLGTRPGSNWASARIRPAASSGNSIEGADFAQFMINIVFTRSLDIYNKGSYIPVAGGFYDVSALSIDTGLVDQRVLGIEHVYAFANLTDIDRKTSMSYAKAEKLVARDTANLVESLDIATAATGTKAK